MSSQARLLKVDQLQESPDGHRAGQVFQFRDLHEKYDRLLSDAKQEAAEMVETAEAEAESARQRTYDRARQDGWDRAAGDLDEEIEKRASLLADERIGKSLSALQQAQQKLEALAETSVARWQTTAVQLAVAIAGKLLRRQLEVRPEDAAAMVAAALQLSAGSECVEVRLHPDDLQLLQSHSELAAASGLSTIDAGCLVADQTVQPGGCLVQTTDGRIDARLPTLLDRITTELLDTDDVA